MYKNRAVAIYPSAKKVGLTVTSMILLLILQEKLKLLTIFGAGLLVGTALAIIIPEGINAIYSNGGGHSHADHGKFPMSMYHSNARSEKKLIEFSVFTSACNWILDQCCLLQFDSSQGVFSRCVVKKSGRA